MNMKLPSNKLHWVEFIALMAVMTALDAFSIDMMMPALSQMAGDLNLLNDNHRQYVITSLILGSSIGVPFYGLISDRFGRRLPVLAGLLIFIIGCLICIAADSFEVFLLGRVVQGMGAAGPYVLTMAIVRDNYSGQKMAQIMSLIMMVFIGIPIIAPLLGQGILLWANWRVIFFVLLAFAVAVALWFGLRQPETLKQEHRRAIRVSSILAVSYEVLSNRQTLVSIISLGMVLGAFMAYLSTSQQVFQEQYGLGVIFPVVFASISASFGFAAYCNSRWVQTVGLLHLIRRALMAVFCVSVLYMIGVAYWGDSSPLWSYILYMLCILFSLGLLFGNMTSLALEPMGHVAGMASSLVSSISSLIAIILATLIGSQLENNVYPIVIGFGLLAAIALYFNYRELQHQTISTTAEV